MDLILSHKTEILGLFLALSEVLALIPSIKANSIFTLIVNVVKKVLG